MDKFRALTLGGSGRARRVFLTFPLRAPLTPGIAVTAGTFREISLRVYERSILWLVKRRASLGGKSSENDAGEVTKGCVVNLSLSNAMGVDVFPRFWKADSQPLLLVVTEGIT